MLAWLDDGHWMDLARHANAQAGALAAGLQAIAGVRLPWQPRVNEVFAILPAAANKALRAAGALYYDWGGRGLEGDNRLKDGEVLVRMVTSFATTEAEVRRFLEISAASSTG